MHDIVKISKSNDVKQYTEKKGSTSERVTVEQQNSRKDELLEILVSYDS